MNNMQFIQNCGILELADCLHKMQAGAIIEGKADSTETLIEWLAEEESEENE